MTDENALNRSTIFPLVLLVAGVSLVWLSSTALGQTIETSAQSVVATFEGEQIDLSEGWGEAQACLIWNDFGVSECFRSEAEMDERIAELEEANGKSPLVGDPVLSGGSTCSGSLRLYDGTSYSSPVLFLADRFQWLNLSAYGFDQKTSSYRVGPCFAYFADLTNGGGDWYPTSRTEAWDEYPSMINGWNNDVSSVYIG